MPPEGGPERSLNNLLQKEHGLSPVLARLFANRWDENPSAAEAFVHSGLEHAGGLDKAPALPAIIERLQHARKQSESILFYGDYDVDGVLAVCIMFRTAQHLGLKANYFLPSRFNEGYGLNERVVRRAADNGYKLIVALDCGTANHKEIELARSLGIDVVVIDHHQSAGEPPDVPIINPQLDDGVDPLCSAGLAYFAAQEWLKAADESPALAEQHFLDLSAIGTIADIVPMTGDCFRLAHNGLPRVTQTKNVGLRAFLRCLKLEGMSHLTKRDVAFNVVPHLNAAGRMAHARLAAELLLTQDEANAAHVASQLLELNRMRRAQQKLMDAEAKLQAEAQKDSAVLVLYKPEWNQGITGIVAAGIAALYQRPAILLADTSTEDEEAIASGRAPEGVDLLHTIEPAKGLFTRVGGHAAAFGGTIPVSRINELRSMMANAELVETEQPAQANECELETTVEELADPRLCESLVRFYPFGEGHPAPMVLLRDASIERASLIGYDRTHLALLVLRPGEAPLRVMGFRMSHLADRIQEGGKHNLQLELELDNYMNNLSVLLRLTGLEDS
jgi:single-stranded-DNA-specific exonuclease